MLEAQFQAPQTVGAEGLNKFKIWGYGEDTDPPLHGAVGGSVTL